MLGKMFGKNDQNAHNHPLESALLHLIGYTLNVRLNACELLDGTTLDQEELFATEHLSDLDIILNYCGIPEEKIVEDKNGEPLVDHPEYFCRDYYVDFILEYYSDIQEEHGGEAPQKLVMALRYMAEHLEDDFEDVVEEALGMIGLEPLSDEDAVGEDWGSAHQRDHAPNV